MSRISKGSITQVASMRQVATSACVVTSAFVVTSRITGAGPRATTPRKRNACVCFSSTPALSWSYCCCSRRARRCARRRLFVPCFHGVRVRGCTHSNTDRQTSRRTEHLLRHTHSCRHVEGGIPPLFLLLEIHRTIFTTRNSWHSRVMHQRLSKESAIM